MTDRKIIELLPSYLQNDQLKKFFNATVDHWFQPEASRKIAGFVGRIPVYHDPQSDYYLNEPTSERQAYQLEATMKSVDSTDDELLSAVAYPDLVNHLRFQGANTDDHSRLFEQEYYSWAPPIDIDMYINFSNYYWYPTGPTLIELRGNVSNPIDVENDILGQLVYTSPNGITLVNGMHVSFGTNVSPASYQADTWIIEGIGRGIILVNTDLQDPSTTPIEYSDSDKDYIIIGRGSKTENPWSRTNHWYHKDLITFELETENDEEAILWDADAWDSTPWDVILSDISSDINLDTSLQAKRPIICFDRDLELYNYGTNSPRSVDYLDTEHDDVFSQIQGQLNGTVSIDGITLAAGTKILVTIDSNPSVNYRIYNVSIIETSPAVFEYLLTIDTTTASPLGDPVIGEKVLITAGVSIGKECHYDGSDYIRSQGKLKANQAPLFNLYDTDGIYIADETSYSDSTFIGNTIFEYKEDTSSSAIIDPELNFGIFYKNFVQISEIVFENTLQTKIYSYEIAPLVRKVIPQYYYYHIAESSGIADQYDNAWHLAPTKTSQSLNNGFYDIPANLQANPDNDTVGEISRSDILIHFGSIISNQPGITGQLFTDTNYKETAQDLSLGTEILQHKAPLLKTMMMTDSDDIDLMLSLRYSQREYRRFYNKFLRKLDSFIDTGYTSAIPASQWLEDIMGLLNVSKQTTLFPFATTRMFPHNENYLITTYDAEIGDQDFTMPGIYDPTDITDPGSILVYIDDVLQIINYDYIINGTLVTLPAPLAAAATVAIRYYSTVESSYVPATPSALGIEPVYKPEIFIDTTYVDPRIVIQGHDGSLTLAYGDDRDVVILELETRIYNTIRQKFQLERQYIFDKHESLPGKYRSNYTLDEYDQILTPIFSTWATKANINWGENTTYSGGDWKTWNWTGTYDTTDGEALRGSWRSIYHYYYDTDRPNTHPWEMLGFSEEPTWWITEYGVGPYTNTNTTLWNDLADGKIIQGEREGTYLQYKRDRLLALIPVNDAGDLLSPQEIGITLNNPSVALAGAEWNVGDMSPAETAMWRSPEGPFISAQISYLMKPAAFVEANWDTEGVDFSTISPDQVINSRYGYRPNASELMITNEDIKIQGIQQWIIDYLQLNNLDATETLGRVLRGLGVSLGWRSSTFAKISTLRFLADSFSPGSTANTQKVFIQDDDIDVELYKSASINEPVYSGVLVEWTGTGYAVFGYDTVYPFFRIIPNTPNGKTISITVGGVTVTETKQGADQIVEVPYGTEFTSRQAVYDFFTEYGRWLEYDGWVFDQYDNTTNEMLNWRYSGKEYLFWSLDALEEGAFITLSPLANQAKYSQSAGFIENVEEIIRGAYTVLDRQGQSINPRDIETIREDAELTAAPTNDQGIFALRLSISTYEHIVLFNNITRFNDTIYIPLLNLRQARLKAFGTIIDNWNGRIDTPGYILDLVTNNDLIPNFEKTANDFLQYHDIENPSENDAITDSARHLIGYQRREYLDQLLVGKDVQYEFYQGMIHQKGSRNSLNKLFRSTAITTSSDVQFFEEWAFRIGQYGGLEIMPPLEVFISSEDVKTDPQLIRFVSGETPDVTSDNIIDILPNDERWIYKSLNEEPEFTLRNKNTYYKKDLPNAGFPQLGETDFLAASVTDLFDDTKSVFIATVANTVWVARDNENRVIDKDWDVLKLLSFADNIWYSDIDNTLSSYQRDTFAGNGVTTNFASTATVDLVASTTYVYLNGEPVDSDNYTILGTDTIGFNTAPVTGDVVEVDAISANLWTDVDTIVYIDDSETRTAGVVGSIGATSITIKDDYVIETGLVSANLCYWESRRYVTAASLSPGDFEDELLYLDGDSANDGWLVVRSDGLNFKELRREEQLINTLEIKNSVIYNDKTNRILASMTTYDPFKGDIPGIADVEITYKLEYDPAKYTNNLDEDAFDEDLAWSEKQIGQVWWDTNKATYLWYEQGNTEYRYQNWGNLFPGAEIKVYEWVRSPVAPSGWADYVASSTDTYNFSSSGTVKDIDTVDGPRWVERSELDNRTRTTKTYYYFWVENSTSTPNLDHRSIPLTEIISVLTDPFGYGLKYCAAIRNDLFIIANVTANLNETDTALQINFNPEDVIVPIHKQWELLREGDAFSDIKDVHWNKMRDSLVRYDDLEKEVPDNRLNGKARYGHFIRPRQTWFEDVSLARQVFIEAVNTILLETDITQISGWDDSLNTEATLQVTTTEVNGSVANPTVTSGYQIKINDEIIVLSGLGSIQDLADEINASLNGVTFVDISYVGTDAYLNLKDSFGSSLNILDVVGTPTTELGWTTGITAGEGPDEIVATRAERDVLTPIAGDRVYVQADENVQSYWTFWEYQNDGTFKLLQIQSYKTNLYWDYTDWYETGYSSATIIDLVFGTLTERNAANTDDGDIVQVTDDGSGKWVLSIKENGQWVTIGKEDATIQFSNTLYDVSTGEYGFDDDLFDTKPYDDVPNVEFREIMNGLRNDILVGQLLLQQNVIFFKMVRHVHTEQELVDWCFKTSYIYLIGFSESLEQKPLFTYDGFESLIDYVKEVKPYHTKIKDVIRTFASTADESEWKVTDFDKPPYDNPDDSSTEAVILDENVSDDIAILSTTEPWSDWWDEYTKDDRPAVPRANNVRKLTTKLVFDRISAIRDNYVPSKTFSDHPDYPDVLAPLPFYESALVVNSANTQDNPEWTLLDAYDGTTPPTNNRATLRLKPYNKIVTVTASGTWTNNSVIVIEGNTEFDFAGDVVTLLNITAAGTYTFSYDDTKDAPFIEANYGAYQSGDIITIKVTTTYDNALSRAIRDYAPTNTMVQLLELMTSEYNGVIMDGSASSTSQGYDNVGWDSVGWDSAVVTLDTGDEITISGGAFYTYLGDDSTDTYNLPPEEKGSAPWRVYVSDTAVNPRAPKLLTETTHYTISGDTVVMVNTSDTWNGTGANLEDGWALAILDSSYASESAEQIIIDGYNFTQSDMEGWPEELTPLKINESIQITVETAGNIILNLLENETATVDGDSVTFVNQTPIVFTFSGIVGDTVVLEGSSTGAFAGEETTIETIVASGSLTVPDVGLGYTPFTYYRARVTVYSAGNIDVVGQIDVAPSANRIAYIGDGTKTVYELGLDIIGSDDLLVTVDGILTEAYTVQLAANTMTFTVAPLLNEDIQLTSWSTTGVADTDPTWSTETYVLSPMDLTTFGTGVIDVKPGPTQPLEGSMLAFVDSGTGFTRLAPPEMAYYNCDGEQNTFIPVPGSNGFASGNISVYLNNTLQTITTHYTFSAGTGTIDDKIVFVSTPVIDSVVSFKTVTNEEFFISGDDIDFTTGVANTDEVGVMAFKDDDQPIGIQTVSWAGNSNADIDGLYRYALFNAPVGSDYVFVTVDDGSGGLDILEQDYEIEYGSGWDQESWDNTLFGFDTGLGACIKLNNSYTGSDRVVITSFGGNPTFAPVTYREFTGWDIESEDFSEFIRFSDTNKTTITTNVVPTDMSIAVTDAFIFPEFGGVAWIGNERVMYGSRTGGATSGAPGTLTELVRGSKGTRKNKTHANGAGIRPGDETEIINDMKNNMANDAGTRLQGSTNEAAIFVNKETGSYF